MIITEIQIDSFGGLCGKHLFLKEGINIIYGNNESGKSTVSDFIRFIFYGVTNRTEAEHYPSLSTGKASGYITISLSENEIAEKNTKTSLLPSSVRIEREYIRKVTDKVRILNAESGTEILRGIIPGEYFFGISADIFSSTAYVSQIGGRSVSGRDLGDAVENILFSADETIDTAKAIDRLDSARAKLMHKNSKGGIIPDLRGQKEALISRVESAKEAHKKLSSAESELESCEKKLEENILKLSEAEKRVEYYEASIELISASKAQQIKEKRETLLREKKLIRRNASYEGFLPNDAYIERLQEIDGLLKEKNKKEDTGNINVKEPDEELARLRSKIEKAGGIHEIELRAEDSLTKRKAYAFLSFILIAVFTASVCIGLYLLIGNEKKGIIPVIIGLTALAGAVITIISRRQSITEYYEILNLAGALDIEDLYRILDEIDQIPNPEISETSNQNSAESYREKENSRAELEAELSELLAYWNMESVEQAVSSYSRFNIRLGEIESEIAHQTELIETADTGADEKRRQQLRKTVAENSYLINSAKEMYNSDNSGNSDNSEISLSPESRKKLAAGLEGARREYNFIKGANEALLKKKHKIELSAVELKAKTEPIAPLCEQLGSVEKRLYEYEHMHAALVLATDRLRMASNALHGRIAPALTRRVSEIVGNLTEHKYTNVGIGNDFSMNFSKNTDENNSGIHTLETSFMSGGTKDTAYIALRIALTEILCKSCPPPIVLDESFCHIDSERLSKMLSFLSEEAENHNLQSIILSSHRREAKIMDSMNYSFNLSEL